MDTRAENNPWPEWPKVCKTDYGQEEAIAVFGHDPRIYQTTVKEFLKDKNGNLNGIITVKLESKKDEKTGRMVMSEVPGSETKLDASRQNSHSPFAAMPHVCFERFYALDEDALPWRTIISFVSSYDNRTPNSFFNIVPMEYK